MVNIILERIWLCFENYWSILDNTRLPAEKCSKYNFGFVIQSGTGKSQFLKFAAKLSNRAVIATGLGSTSAGLTVTAVKDGGITFLTSIII